MRTIVDVCEAHWEAWKDDCSGFLKAVAADVGISLHGQANAIIDQVQGHPWQRVGSAREAVALSGQRYLVIAGLKATGNGHVAVIVPGDARPWPHAYWGQIHGVGRKNETINWSWSSKPKVKGGVSDLAKVAYFACPIPSPIAIQ